MYKYLYKVNNGKRNGYIFKWIEAGDGYKDALRIWIPETRVFKSYSEGYNNYEKVCD